ncbi:hypothetical protein M378DRAFT_533522 [Amanita muscaria Koide BX008]|uniref:Uncharacterized protein n=1 Tax=Amanita muscaria (strain Koide BX008) TaxID=946122 RepID=A0A0C2W4Z4_AMAMK|nr:hypothetical protein M378DRAFT_533522 [Amanita muscaria Koide BX008]
MPYRPSQPIGQQLSRGCLLQFSFSLNAIPVPMSGQSPPHSRRSQPPGKILIVPTSSTITHPFLDLSLIQLKYITYNRETLHDPLPFVTDHDNQNHSPASRWALPPLCRCTPITMPNLSVNQARLLVPHPVKPIACSLPNPNYQIHPTHECRLTTSPATAASTLSFGGPNPSSAPMHNSPPRVIDKYQGDWATHGTISIRRPSRSCRITTSATSGPA